MSRKFTIGMLAVAATLGMSAPSFAAGVGAISPTTTGWDSYEYDFSDTLTSKGNFSDSYSFTLPEYNGHNMTYDIDFFFYSTATSTQAALAQVTSAVLNGVNLGLTSALDVTPLGGGHYRYQLDVSSSQLVKTYALASHMPNTLTTDTLVINGVAGAGSDSYSGYLTINAVPEPSTWALMLGGLAAGALAFVAQRRRAFAAA